ncbi:MAG: FG-GAP-like repeat-containing protein, partial [Candidatus Thermoplasmatota archaeon]
LCEVNVTDSAGNKAYAWVKITVVPSPADIYSYFTWLMEDDEGLTAYDIYNETGRVTRVGTRIFWQGETVYIQVASLNLRKIKIQNTCILYDSQFNKLEPQTKEYEPLDPNYVTGGPLDEPAFYELVSPDPKFYFYEYNFSAPTTAGQYLIYAAMKDTFGNRFLTWDTIYVRAADGSIPNYPKLITCRDTDGNGAPDTVSQEFVYTEKMYVKYITNDLNAITGVNMGDVEVNNFRGTWHIKKKLPVPPTTDNLPLSKLFFDSNVSGLSWADRADSNNFYTFYLDLTHPNHYNWLKGWNSYVLLVRWFDDANERYNLLATLVRIRGRVSTIDIVATTGILGGWWSTGTNSVQWYDNGMYWDRTTVAYQTLEAPKALAVGDIDGDGDNDIVVGTEDDRDANLCWFENLEPNGKEWLAHFITTAYGPSKLQYKVESVAIADLDYDGDSEIIAGMKDSAGTTSTGIHVFLNDGDWTDILLQPMTGGIAKPLQKGPNDTTGENLSYILLNDEIYYNVSGSKTLQFNLWNITGLSGVISGVVLYAQYKTEAGYKGDRNITWRIADRGAWNNTTIKPIETTTERTESFDLYSQDPTVFSDWNNTRNLNITFWNNDYDVYLNTPREEYTIWGSAVSGSSVQTQVSDNVYESLQELNATGVKFTEGDNPSWQLINFPSNNGYGDPGQSFTTTARTAVVKVGLYIRRAATAPSPIYLE